MKAIIKVTVKTVPHPDQATAVDLFAKIVLKRILEIEKQSREGNEDESVLPGNQVPDR